MISVPMKISKKMSKTAVSLFIGNFKQTPYLLEFLSASQGSSSSSDSENLRNTPIIEHIIKNEVDLRRQPSSYLFQN